MKTNIILTLLLVTVFSCKSVEQRPVTLTFDFDPCDYLSVNKLSPILGLLVTDIIAQSAENSPNKKVCTYYRNISPKPEPLVNVSIEYNPDKTSSGFSKVIESMLVNGLPGSSGIMKYKKIDDDRFNAIYTQDESLFNQAYIEVANQYLVVIEYDKKLSKQSGSTDLIIKIIESVLYDEKVY